MFFRMPYCLLICLKGMEVRVMDNKKKKIAFLVILLLGCAITSVFSDYVNSGGTRQANLLPVAGQTTAKAKSSEKKITVYVSGAVAEPGLYELAAGSRALDAVAAAGGLTEAADRERVNLARNLKDGNQVNVPAVKQKATRAAAQGKAKGSADNATGRSSTSKNQASVSVKLNTASAAELESLPGVGPALAQRIVAYRQGRRFGSVDDLLKVKGLGKAKLERLRPLVEVD